MAQYSWVTLCWTRITREREPVPRVVRREKSPSFGGGVRMSKDFFVYFSWNVFLSDSIHPGERGLLEDASREEIDASRSSFTVEVDKI